MRAVELLRGSARGALVCRLAELAEVIGAAELHGFAQTSTNPS
jgi:hypothetical protein